MSELLKRAAEIDLEKLIKKIVKETLPEEILGVKVLGKIIENMKGGEGKPGKDGEPGKPPTPEEILALIRPLILEVKDSATPTDEYLLELIKPLIPQIKDGATPVAGLDYPTREQIENMVKELAPKEKDITSLIEKLIKNVQTEFNPEKIARSLETLQGSKQLDYYSLKNRPDIPNDKQISSKVRSVLRGGGDISRVYDLSDLLDGVTKTFTMPSHRKIVAIHADSAPFSAFRPTIDYTRTTTSVTFTSSIDAGITLATGHSLMIEYVE